MWIEQNNELIKRFLFDDFKNAIQFINALAIISEKHNHHPTIINTYNIVDIVLTTHDAQNTLTELDRKMAIEIDKIYNDEN